MSLVINSNAGEPSWQRQSNRMLPMWKYLDFSQILLKPKFVNPTVNYWSWNIWPTDISEKALTVNWTPINYLCCALSESSYFKWSSTGGNYWSSWNLSFYRTTTRNWATVATQTITYRIWTFSWLEWWEIIWKKIIWDIFACFYNTWNTWTGFNLLLRVNVKVWLLHTNWTIEYLPEYQWTQQRMQNNHNTSRDKYFDTFWFETDWLTAQAWDIVICDITNEMSTDWTWTQSWSFYLVNFWWYDWSVNDYSTTFTDQSVWNIWPKPIQISID